jgi:hypothetical protein
MERWVDIVSLTAQIILQTCTYSKQRIKPYNLSKAWRAELLCWVNLGYVCLDPYLSCVQARLGFCIDLIAKYVRYLPNRVLLTTVRTWCLFSLVSSTTLQLFLFTFLSFKKTKQRWYERRNQRHGLLYLEQVQFIPWYHKSLHPPTFQTG